MKIRSGFVSNSSSSSFVLYGASFDMYDNNVCNIIAKKIIDNLPPEEVNEFKDICIEEDGSCKDRYELREYMENYVPKGYDLETDYDSDHLYIGLDPTNFPENKTINEMKLKIKENLIKSFGDIKNLPIGWYRDCYMDH